MPGRADMFTTTIPLYIYAKLKQLHLLQFYCIIYCEFKWIEFRVVESPYYAQATFRRRLDLP